MTGLVGGLLVLWVFAWVVRGLLGAREVTWVRLLVATALGFLLGLVVAGVLVVDLEQLARAPGTVTVAQDELLQLALPFQIVLIMTLVVVFEVLLSRPARPRGLRLVRPVTALRRQIGIWLRTVQISRIAARHGLAPLLGLRRGDVSPRSPAEIARRARIALEEAGGMFVKLGQLLATRPDLVPPEALAELSRLQSSAQPLGRAEIEAALRAETGDPTDVFAHIDWEPLGSASIAQVHTARLHDGRDVVVKLRRPGLEDRVERDLAIALWLARTAERRTAWGRTYGAVGLAQGFAEALRAELDFRNEARATLEVADAVAQEPVVRVPGIVTAWTTPRLLIMDRLTGTPLSRAVRDGTVGDARALADALCTSQLRAMLHGDRFHGDPHPGNILLLDDGRLGLIDFGMTGALDAFERASMRELLLAIRLRQPTLLYEALVSAGAVHPAREPDELERALARFMVTSLGPDMPPAEAVNGLLGMATELGLRLPPQTATMFRALATLSETLERLCPGYPLIDKIAELGGEELRAQVAPTSVGQAVQQEWAQVAPSLRRAPRHLDRVATLLEHGALVTNLRLFSEAGDVAVVERLLNRAVLAAVALGLTLIAVLMLGTDGGPSFGGTDVTLIHALGWVALFAGTVLLLRVLLEALRPPR